MKTCDYCTHVEMCGWRKEVKEQGCEFFGDDIVWIPCSERLPSIGDSGVSDMVLLCWSDGQRTVGAYQGNRTFVGQAWPVARDCRVTVIAWMPLPKPYREDGEA